MPARLFSIKDDLILKELYSKFTNRELVSVFNGQYSIKQIKFRGKDLGLLKDPDIKEKAQQTRTGTWEEWENEIIRKHYSKDGIEFVCNIITGRTKSSILHKANRLGFFIPTELRKPRESNYVCTDEARHKMSLARLGKSFGEEHKKNLSLGSRRGKDHPHYNPNRQRKYGFGFTNVLKKEIFLRDNHNCVLCNKHKKLVVHHIDYNKEHNETTNLVSLCYQCHGKHHYMLDENKKISEQNYFVNIARQRK